jgi:hypothetical protein
MANIRINPRLEAQITGPAAAHGPLGRLLGNLADQAAREAQRIARAEFYNRGDYMRGIHGDSVVDKGTTIGRVVGRDWKSHWGEFPPRQQRARRGHILARGAERIGLRVEATPTGAGNLALGRGGGGPARRGSGRGRIR